MSYAISKELFETVVKQLIIEYRGVFIDSISGTYNNKVDLGGGLTVVATDGGIEKFLIINNRIN